MLVVSRKRGEQIQIGDNVTITLLDIRGDKARIGIEAPRDMPVNRMEIHRRILEAKALADDAEDSPDE